MFARDKRIGPYTYVYLVENVREEGRTKQRIIANLGARKWSLRAVISTGWRAPSSGWRSVDGAVAGRGRSPAPCKVSADWTGAAVRAAVA